MFTRKDLKNATIHEKDKILNFYHSFIGESGCTWSMDYPDEEIFLRDIKNKSLYYIEDERGIAATISIDEDKVVEDLEIWTIKNAAELSRVGVRKDIQNKSVARFMITTLMDVLREQGYEGVHFLVSQHNKPALASYKKLGFTNLGPLYLYHEEWFCYEKKL